MYTHWLTGRVDVRVNASNVRVNHLLIAHNALIQQISSLMVHVCHHVLITLFFLVVNVLTVQIIVPNAHQEHRA